MNFSESTDFRLNWGIKRRSDGRYILIDASCDSVLDNCQGKGFETYGKAYNYEYNKYHTNCKCNGKPNIDEFCVFVLNGRDLN